MTFPPQAHTARTNHKRIDAEERDRIEAALRINSDPALHTLTFDRSFNTINRIRMKSGIGK